MPNRLFRLPGVTRRLLLALLLSLLLHTWMIGGLDGWSMEDDSPEATPIRVELMPPPAPRPVAKPPLEKTRPAPPKPVARPVPLPVVAEPPAERSAEPPPQSPEPPEPAPAPAPPPQASAAPVPEPLPQPVPEQAPPAEAEAPAAKTPSRVAIDFQIVRKGGVAGLERQRYQVGEDGSYTLTSQAEAKGLLALVLSGLVQESEGQVTEHGLKPASFLYQYGKNPEKAQKATFDWQNKRLIMQVGSQRQTAELEAGTQDMLSFMYQFMFVPPLQQMQLAVTNGKMLRVYNYVFEGEDALKTGMGTLRTLHISKGGGAGEDKMEIWLAADYHYLPVKISKTDKDGTLTERIATNLQLE